MQKWTNPLLYLKQYEFDFKYEPVKFEDLPVWNEKDNPNAKKLTWFRFRGPTYQLKGDNFDEDDDSKRNAKGDFFQVNTKINLHDQDSKKVYDIIKPDGTSLTFGSGIKDSQFGTPNFTFEKLVSDDTNNYIYTGELPDTIRNSNGTCCEKGKQDPDMFSRLKGGKRSSYRKLSSRKSKKSITSRRSRNSRKRRYSRRR